MFGFLERKRLVKKGLASPKTRRRRSHSELIEGLQTGNIPKALIFLVFITGLWELINYGQVAQPAEKFLIALLIFVTALAQLWVNHPITFATNSRILMMFGSIFVHLMAVKAMLVAAQNAHSFDAKNTWELLIPYAFAPLICSVLLGKNQGLYAATFVSLWGSILLPGIDAHFLVTSLICGFIAVFLTLQVRRRSRLIRAGIFVGLARWMLAVIFGQIGPIIWEALVNMDWNLIGLQSLVAIGSGLLTAMLVGGALPILEHLFRITTDISWLEMADLNHPLLKRMIIEAPGTYHHSLVVANLSESAAEVIGANPTMCRVCSYFHDIGKLVKPDYFIENISRERNSPHNGLAPTMSALIIIAHVKEGVDLALKHKLNQQVVDTIQQHHGNSLCAFFYKRALQQQEDARQGGKIMNIREEDIPEVREESFRYAGPKPQTRETGIIMLADAVESAARSLEKITPQRLEQLINDIFEQRILDRQLDECHLTLKEIRLIGESFKFTLHSMLHSRISYPKETPKAFRTHEDGPHSPANPSTTPTSQSPTTPAPVSAA